jgi:hypothetical protein
LRSMGTGRFQFFGIFLTIQNVPKLTF